MIRCLDDNDSSSLQKKMWRDKAIGMARFILPTHHAGGVLCRDKKQWHDQWQSALWASTAGKGLWLLWDDLPPDLRWLTARMVADEADRFISINPPSQVNNDTKAEENAWNSTVISLAACMFPHHPHSELWKQAAIRWAAGSFVRKQDLVDNPVVDGKPLSQWGVGPTLHDDYTLENHGRVHPDYMNTIHLLLNQVELYSWAGLQPPEALSFNTQNVYEVLKFLSLPDGSYIYPNGQDWQLHRNIHWLEPHFAQAVLNHDRQAATLARECLDCGERMIARTSNGGVFLPEEFSFPSTQQYALELLAQCYVVARSKGDGAEPLAEPELESQLAGYRTFVTGKFAVQRTSTTIASFSWGRQNMGLIMPLVKDELLAPNEHSLLGFVGVKNVARDVPRILSLNVIPSSTTMLVCGSVARGDGALEQRFGICGLPDGEVVYVDTLRATSSTVVTRLDLDPLCILNDPHWVYHNAQRTLYSRSGKLVFDASGPATDPPVQRDSNWYDLDNIFGIVRLAATGTQEYVPNHKIGNGRLEQNFYLNKINVSKIGRVSRGERISVGAFVFLPRRDSKQTKRAANTIKLRRRNNSTLFTVALDDGKSVRFDLSKLQASVLSNGSPN
jgi:hypothetical protein